MAKIKAPKTRNNGTMTEAAFWGMIRSALRSRSMYWLPIHQAKIDARKPYTGHNKRQKWEYLCNICKKYYMEKEVIVDHIKPVGSLTCANDLPEFVENLFCESQFLGILCSDCHRVKTKEDNILTKEKRKCKNKTS